MSGKISLFLSTLLVVVLMIVIGSSFSKIELSNFQPFFPKGITSVGTFIKLVLWSFFGWEAICNLSDKFSNSEKDIVKGTIISAGIIGTLFMMLSIITVGTNTYGNLESNMSPIGILMEESIEIEVKYITAVLAFVICLGTVNAFIASLAQLGFALSQDGAFPACFSKKALRQMLQHV